MVIQTKSVEYMPFLLSFFMFLNWRLDIVFFPRQRFLHWSMLIHFLYPFNYSVLEKLALIPMLHFDYDQNVLMMVLSELCLKATLTPVNVFIKMKHT